MSIDLETPETALGMVDAAANFVEQIRLATMTGDKTRVMYALDQAGRLLFDAMRKIEDEEDQPAGLGAAGAQMRASEPDGGIQQLSDTERIDWIEKNRWEQNEAHGPYKAFCQICMTHYGSVIPLREAIDLAMNLPKP